MSFSPFPPLRGGGGVVQKSKTAAKPKPAVPPARDFFPVNADSSASDPEYDLFGNVVEPLRDRRGRPSFKKTKENQDFVAVRAAAGWKQNQIAEEIGCDEKTLRKYFSRELDGGALIVEGMCLDVLMQGMRKGHVPSIKQLQARLDRTSGQAPKSPKGEKTPQTKELGKKEQRLSDAGLPSPDYGDLYNRIHRQ